MIQRAIHHQGHVIGGRYQVQQNIGSGGMSHVYLVDDLKLSGKQWAVKQCFLLQDQHNNIEDEAELLTTLSHPRLPRIVDFFPPDGSGDSYLVMDYIHGVTLEKYFLSHHRKLKSDFILQIAQQAIEVLEYLHKHDPPIVFRDLKPSNIMLTSNLELRLIDFGIARNYKQEQDQDTVKLGTVGFAAPEQYGSGQSDARSDLYGLGALLLYLVTEGAHSEWSEGVENRIRSDFPKGKIPILRKLLQIVPDDRYQSTDEVRFALFPTTQTREQNHNQSYREMKGIHLGTHVIAVMGVSSGVGTTHTAISVVHYLARLFKKVAIVELDEDSISFSRIQQIVEGTSIYTNKQDLQFSVEGVDYYRQATSAKVIELLSSGYNFIVLDMGSYVKSDRLDEFLRADIPLLVGWGSEWKLQDLEELIKSLMKYHQNKWVYCIPLAPLDAVKRLRKKISSTKVYTLPLHVDPFDRSGEMDKVLNKILHGYVPSLQKGKRFRFGVGSRSQ
ncbi:protein kinase domain-containing protein [Paenibacillus crassostreae]|uniref:non-specific serine/threonine protein kinase n=1 Tax=Paenibacillus crassostreae TaxID=1763538 RepID=A0A167DSE9_9BACL|nr:protein kinase [Paenibacillus crassostreae]AOZ91112.1 serine/threonine protein kinase [Paenibacillus crassostreae]OAB74728.1 serine/threonine protein kinase [Paenibacillus crassostreae]